MFIKPNPASGVALYVQLMQQIKHAIETGALRGGDQLPAIRTLAEQLVMNPNTIAKVYRELEHEGVIEIRQGLGAFVSESANMNFSRIKQAQPVLSHCIEKLRAKGLTDEEIRRLFDAEMVRGQSIHRG
jgi:GntR family transcriptional regulator